MFLQKALTDSLVHLNEKLLGNDLQSFGMFSLRNFIHNRIFFQHLVDNIHIVLKRILVQVMNCTHAFEREVDS